MNRSAATLTLQDIADLARVQRPVVSLWRTRQVAKGQVIPFPAPVAMYDKVEHFDRDDVVEWLHRTGRGNNRDGVRLDAATIAMPPGADLEELTTLLCLRMLAGIDLGGLDPAQLADLADEVDPDDELIYSEIEELTPRGVALTPYVDELLDAAYSPADALDRLERGRLKRESSPGEFRAEAVRLVAAVADALATHLAPDETRLIDGSAGRSRLAIQVTTAWRDGGCQALVVEGDTRQARGQRRAALLRGVDVDRQTGGSAVVVLSVAGVPEIEAIEAIDELQLSLPDDRVAVVVGPARLLCDRLDDRAVEGHRDQIVRTGRLRLAARLPRGLWLAGPRQAMGLWVFGSAVAERIEDRAIGLADLSHEELTDATFGDLATDALAAQGDVRLHAFRFARAVPTSKMIAGRLIVPRGVRALHLLGRSPAERAVQIDDLRDALNAPLPTFAVTPRPRADDVGEAVLTLAELMGRRIATVKPGARLNRSLARPGEPVRLVDPLLGDTSLGFDPLELERENSRALRTEPNDVVFTSTPRPAATVDVRGGSVVAYPARVLRLSVAAPVGPRLLAHTINRQPKTAREWRNWAVPVVPTNEQEHLEDALVTIARTREQLGERLSAAARLADALIDGVAAGAVTLTPEEEGH
jgi:hypothetical protein